MNAAETLQDAFDRGEINRMSFDVANEGLFSSNATKEANSRSPETVAVFEPLKMFPWWAWALLAVAIVVVWKPKFLR